MSSYAEEALAPGESILLAARMSWATHAPFIFLAAIMILVALVGQGFFWWLLLPALWLLAQSGWVWLGTEMVITTERVIVKKGLIARDTLEIQLRKIESTSLRQGVLGRLFDFGDARVSGVGSTQWLIQGVARPADFLRALSSAMERADKD